MWDMNTSWLGPCGKILLAGGSSWAVPQEGAWERENLNSCEDTGVFRAGHLFPTFVFFLLDLILRSEYYTVRTKTSVDTKDISFCLCIHKLYPKDEITYRSNFLLPCYQWIGIQVTISSISRATTSIFSHAYCEYLNKVTLPSHWFTCRIIIVPSGLAQHPYPSCFFSDLEHVLWV